MIIELIQTGGSDNIAQNNDNEGEKMLKRVKLQSVPLLSVLRMPICCSVAQSCPILCDPMDCSTPGFLVLHHFLELAETHVHQVSDAIQPSHPLSSLSSIFPSIRVFSNEPALRIRWPKYQSFSFSISPSTEYSGLISFRIDWLDLFAVQGTLKSLLQHQSSKASIIQHSACFLLHPYILLLEKPWL